MPESDQKSFFVVTLRCEGGALRPLSVRSILKGFSCSTRKMPRPRNFTEPALTTTSSTRHFSLPSLTILTKSSALIFAYCLQTEVNFADQEFTIYRGREFKNKTKSDEKII